MFKRTAISGAVLVAIASGAPMTVSAQESTQRIEITGSSIKRIDAEGALPVTVITREQIDKTGLTSVTDLIQSLPSMQGFLTGSQSVNGSGGGATNASIHGIGSRYTLVLLNGRRVAPYNTGTTVNLESIPLAAIERIEVLTDGASALYGADAIAGVVNFITRKDSTEGSVSLTANRPQHPGGGSSNFSIVKGFGDLEKDKFNVLLSFSYDKQQELNASQRPFANTGFRPFTTLPDGRTLGTFFQSSNSVPGNVALVLPDGSDLSAFYSPYYYLNGNACPAAHQPRPGGYGQNVCRYDFASTVQLVPASERTSFFASGRTNLSNSLSLFAEAGLSRFANEPRYAPPAQPGLYLTQAQYDKYVTPLLGTFGLTAADVAPVGDANGNGPTMNVRVFDAGGRKDKYTTDTIHLVAGGEGTLAGWDYRASLTRSENRFKDEAEGGYMSKNFFYARINDGTYDPLGMTVGQAVSVLAPGVLHQVLDESKSTLTNLLVNASSAIAKTSAGDVQLGLGAELARQQYTDSPSAILQGANPLQPNYTDAIIGGGGGALPFDSSRKSLGVFSELIVPVVKSLEFTGALRFDSYGAVSNSKNFDPYGNPLPAETQGKSASSSTYKLSARYQPQKEVLFRASYGTGFKAPTLADITNPLTSGGVTTASYDCPITAAVSATLAAGCRPANSQYNILSGGNASTASDALKPEKSTQWTLGVRFEPADVLSAGVDLWNVSLRDRIQNIPEQVAFANASAYLSLFTISPDPISGQNQLTFISKPLNLGKAQYRGLDLDVTTKFATDFGKLTSKFTATYLLTSKYEIPGLPGYQTSLGQFGPDNEVAFRWLANLSTTLQTGKWTNTLNISWKPGYQDYVATRSVNSSGSVVYTGPELRIYNADGSVGGRYPSSNGSFVRQVSTYSVADIQVQYAFDKALTLTGGIKNVLDTPPPFSIQDAGGGNMRGYDGRYADPIGRAYYLSASYKF